MYVKIQGKEQEGKKRGASIFWGAEECRLQEDIKIDQ